MKKCVVWDLDNTLWDGVCLEGNVELRPGIVITIQELDRRGVLHSIASRGDEEVATQTLKRFGLDSFFLVPQINWLPKPQNVGRISKELGLPPDSIAFVDDERFEREQMTFMLPDVLTIDSREGALLQDRPEFAPEIVTGESRQRRTLYVAELSRKQAERESASREEFLHSCAMKLKIRSMCEEDIPRVLELMTRTHQLNTSGLLFEREDLLDLHRRTPVSGRALVGDLEDRFGPYGCIGTALVGVDKPVARLSYLAISCRVMGRGVERAFLAWIASSVRKEGVRWLEAEFRDTGRNRMMRAFYQMGGLKEMPDTRLAATKVFRGEIAQIPSAPTWMEMQ